MMCYTCDTCGTMMPQACEAILAVFSGGEHQPEVHLCHKCHTRIHTGIERMKQEKEAACK